MYRIEFAHTAARTLEAVAQSDRKLCGRLIAAIESLSRDPFQGKPLKGQFKGDWSLRVGPYRIVYAIARGKLTIYIIDVGHRREIYRR